MFIYWVHRPILPKEMLVMTEDEQHERQSMRLVLQDGKQFTKVNLRIGVRWQSLTLLCS